jgi:hypothetical protein
MAELWREYNTILSKFACQNTPVAAKLPDPDGLII